MKRSPYRPKLSDRPGHTHLESNNQMKFYSLLTAMSLMVGFIAPIPAIFASNPPQKVAAVEHSNPPPKPHRGQGRRELNG